MRRRDGDKRRRAERQEEADARALGRSARTPYEQIDRIALRPGWSAREAARLATQITEAGGIGGTRLA